MNKNQSQNLFIAQMDSKRDKNEEEFILKQLGAFSLFPHKDLKKVEKGDVVKTLNESVAVILEKAPHMRSNLLRYFIDAAFADGDLDKKELALICDFGLKLGFPESEISKALGMKIQEDFCPKASALK